MKTKTFYLSILLLLSALTVTNRASREIWITPGANDSGDGSYNNAYGMESISLTDLQKSTNFDNLMVGFAPGDVIHLLPGKFYTKGQAHWSVKSGQRILGAGKSATTLELTGQPYNNSYMVLGNWNTLVTQAEVADMTIQVADASWTNHCGVISAVGIGGTKNAIRRVRAVHCGSTTTTEPFVLGLWGASDNSAGSDDNIIENCEVSDMIIQQSRCSTNKSAGSTAFGLTAVHATGTNSWIQGTVRYCTAYLPAVDTNHPAGWGLAYNHHTTKGVNLFGNYAQGGTSGIYSDSNSHKDMIIAHNFVGGALRGIDLRNEAFSNIWAINNLIELPAMLDATNFVCGLYSHATTNLFVSLNIFDLKSSTNGQGIYISNGKGAQASLNQVSPHLYSKITSDATNYSFYANTKTTGPADVSIFVSSDVKVQTAPPNRVPRRTASASSTLDLSDRFVAYTGSANQTFTLPSATDHPGKDLTITHEGSGGTLTVACAGSQRIYPTYVSSLGLTSYGTIRLVSNGQNWFKLQ